MAVNSTTTAWDISKLPGTLKVGDIDVNQGIGLGRTPTMNDLNDANLSLTDRFYLAGLSAKNNPDNQEAQSNWANWYNAMSPYMTQTQSQVADVSASTNPQPGQTPISEYVPELITNPSTNPNTQFSPTLQQVQDGELLQGGQLGTNPQAASVAPQAGHANAVTAGNAVQVGQQPKTAAGNYNASQVGAGNAAQATAAQGQVNNQAQVQAAQGQYSAETMDAMNSPAQGTVDPNSLVKNQYSQLMDFEAGQIPDWGKGAVRQAEAAMAARGLGPSSIAAEAITSALMAAALPIAQQDAKVYETLNLKNLDNRQQSIMAKATFLAQMDMANLNNRQQAAVANARAFLDMDLANLNNAQQASIINAQNRQQILLSDQAALNAAKQFNATNQQQNDQFFANLSANIAENNARRTDAMKQFNAESINKINASNAANATQASIAGAQLQADINKFNASIADQRERFNLSNQLLIEQSNATWRRMLNTSNTAAINAANQQNVQNLFNISQWGLAATWQQFRDEAAWANQSAENSDNRSFNMALAALQRQTIFDQLDEIAQENMYRLIGDWAIGTVNNIIK